MTSQPLDDDTARVRKIAQRLIEQTRAGKIHWEPAGDWSYVYSTSSSSVTLRCRDRDDDFPYVLAVYNSAGAVVAEVEFSGSDELGRAVADLYRRAGRIHLNVDQTLDGLLSELEGPLP